MHWTDEMLTAAFGYVEKLANRVAALEHKEKRTQTHSWMEAEGPDPSLDTEEAGATLPVEEEVS